MDVMFYETFREEQKLLIKLLPKKIKAEFTARTIQEHAKKTATASLISIRTQSVIPKSWAPHLKGIFTRSTGYEHLLTYLKATGRAIPCGYLPDYCARAVAEQAILLMMALLRKWNLQTTHFQTFNRDDLTGKECLNRKILVIGVGKIGTEVARIALGLGMTVKGVDIQPTFRKIPYVTLHQGLSWAEVAVCALPLTEKTRGLLNYQVLKRMAKGAIFINISRGEVSPTQDLIRLRKNGILEGIGLDVFEDEHILASGLRHPASQRQMTVRQITNLRKMENVILTPHNAFNTCEALYRKAQQSVEAVSHFLKENTFPHCIP